MTREYYVIVLDGNFIQSEISGWMEVGFRKATHFTTPDDALLIAQHIKEAKIMRVKCELQEIQ